MRTTLYVEMTELLKGSFHLAPQGLAVRVALALRKSAHDKKDYKDLSKEFLEAYNKAVEEVA